MTFVLTSSPDQGPKCGQMSMEGHGYFTSLKDPLSTCGVRVQQASTGDALSGMFKLGVHNLRKSGRSSALFSADATSVCVQDHSPQQPLICDQQAILGPSLFNFEGVVTHMPWPLACDFDRSSDLQVGIPPWALSTTKIWHRSLSLVARTFFTPKSFPMCGSVRTVENAGRAVRGVACIG